MDVVGQRVSSVDRRGFSTFTPIVTLARDNPTTMPSSGPVAVGDIN
jgi:hypothetical protein